jgi:hypothetical protein
MWLLLALWIAGETEMDEWLKLLLLGLVVGLLVLTRTSGVVLAPAVLYMLWASWMRRGKGAAAWSGLVRLAFVAGVAVVLWEGYVRLLVLPHHAADWAMLSSLHARHVTLRGLPGAALQTLEDGAFVSPVMFWMAVVVVVLSVVWLRELWGRPLFGAAVIAAAGQMAYVTFRGEFEPQSFVVMAIPVMIVVGLGAGAVVDRRRVSRGEGRVRWVAGAAVAALLVAAGMMAVQTGELIVHPDYSYWEAAQGIASIIDEDGGEKPMLLSDSSDDLTLWTGIAGVRATAAPDGLDAVLERYEPGWYAAWPGWNDATTEQLESRYRLDAVARYMVLDDPARPTLVLYKMTPR